MALFLTVDDYNSFTTLQTIIYQFYENGDFPSVFLRRTYKFRKKCNHIQCTVLCLESGLLG
jgi:hypothetical protein